MGLMPIEAELELKPRCISAQDQIHPQRAVAERATQNHPCQQGATFLHLHLPSLRQRQRMLQIVARKIPGIPELAMVLIALDLNRSRELIHALGILQTNQTALIHFKRKTAVAETPVLLGKGLHPDGMTDRFGGRTAGDRVNPALERQGHDACGFRKLDPNAATGSLLHRQIASLAAPITARQLQKRRPTLQRLQTTPGPRLNTSVGWRGTRGLAIEQAAQTLRASGCRLTACAAPLKLRLIEDLRNRGAGKDVVELLEQKRRPIPARHRLRTQRFNKVRLA